LRSGTFSDQSPPAEYGSHQSSSFLHDHASHFVPAVANHPARSLLLVSQIWKQGMDLSWPWQCNWSIPKVDPGKPFLELLASFFLVCPFPFSVMKQKPTSLFSCPFANLKMLLLSSGPGDLSFTAAGISASNLPAPLLLLA
jgi:hypothetical protein